MKELAILFLSFYKKFISPLLERVFGGGCKFVPTCSEYAAESIKQYGVWKGGILSIKRFGRCHPFTKGLYDPVP
ncbi:membrane protein insertion efficiency factor YidD [Candidatus Woesebacteria bacterium RIFCSPHIGHO2_01_FULL_39_32]|uniref:Putative membrane protein insertion efficiency factor n=1 Tax=Candidatus Woesebacteria bacterium RIFCSPLOWO2_01_FULL_39_25 TaxID=1802521 RepID=A0A1F8BIS6_9BACT|nr:MAG: membrane protein insertion efficiency factor YidD [Candidatus Woesebacteria bacterium GWB1_37_5]OGM25042.1 MAG: membrane protein insertion efficiency factor YidD [Candidatus Woesebacteria bacterium RIFCSPHIGHO2_01_FULL_39_32]OGM36630.1 MAG: membrane protein insertion efficiency factor YidD [Candidatus Woesebacteria bacterium RIFCSPHIGHO2_12_FULL_38_11]OGM63957.1 MAG: membrane protein insertion efficiency factor YidD [Candidatus Woesebacteria bacterium RIFCSPLOWO2_01_FULL_39_25]